MTTGEAPRTEAGRALLDDPHGTAGILDAWGGDDLRHAILAIEREAAAAPPEPPRPDLRALELIRDLQPQAVAYIRQYGFVFDKVGPLADDADEVDRWKVLAFSLYTDVVEASTAAERMLDAVAAPEGLSLDVERLRIKPGNPDYVTKYGHGWNDALHAMLKARREAYGPSSGESGSPAPHFHGYFDKDGCTEDHESGSPGEPE